MFKKIAPDKWKHFYVGILMGLILQAAGLWFFADQPVLGTGIVLLIVIAISYGFELFSKFTGFGIYDFMDAVASVVGGVLGMIIAALVMWML
jgi:glycopeptide antibiotics resistance protein